jgi:hypothetical protein
VGDFFFWFVSAPSAASDRRHGEQDCNHRYAPPQSRA